MIPIPAAFVAGPAGVRVDRDVITAQGPDTEVYLQGQLSQDVSALGVGESAWSLLLEPQGKVQSWLRVSRVDDEMYLLDLDAGAGEAALARLTRFKLRTACDLTLETWSIVAVRGPGANEITVDGAVAAAAEWPGIDGVDLLAANAPFPEGLGTASPEDLELLRILAGVPRMGAELDESVIPAEAGIVDRSASFTKGCYTGQELVARIDSRGGNVPKRLCGVVVEGSAAAGSDVVVDGDPVGVLTSVAPANGQTIGLAYIKRAVEAPAGAAVGDGSAEIRALPLIG